MQLPIRCWETDHSWSLFEARSRLGPAGLFQGPGWPKKSPFLDLLVKSCMLFLVLCFVTKNRWDRSFLRLSLKFFSQKSRNDSYLSIQLSIFVFAQLSISHFPRHLTIYLPPQNSVSVLHHTTNSTSQFQSIFSTSLSILLKFSENLSFTRNIKYRLFSELLNSPLIMWWSLLLLTYLLSLMIKLFNKQVEIIFAKTNSTKSVSTIIAAEELQQCAAQPTVDLWGAKLCIIQKLRVYHYHNIRNFSIVLLTIQHEME